MAIVYCDKCGEYLGDRINGVLFKFGKVVTEIHNCEGKDDTTNVGRDRQAKRPRPQGLNL